MFHPSFVGLPEIRTVRPWIAQRTDDVANFKH